MIARAGSRAPGGARHRRLLAGLAASVLLACSLLPSSAVAQGAADPAASAWFETEQGKVRLVAAAPQLGTADGVRLGLEFRLAPGWHIYWRAPRHARVPPPTCFDGRAAPPPGGR